MSASNELPPGAFADPYGGNRREVEALLRRALAIILDHITSAARRPPLPEQSVPEFWAEIPEAPVAEEEIFRRLSAVMDASMNAASPGYIGHMDSLPATFSIVGDLAAAALNNNMLSHDMSAALSHLEPALCRAFARRFGLGARSGGVLVSGGTLANLEALTVARNARVAGAREEGVAGRARRPVLFASELAHNSIEKAAMILGLGTRGYIPVRADERGKMDAAALREAIRAARDSGAEPFAAVATAGTTTTGNIDPISEIADIAAAEGLWLHVDAVYGGALIFSEERAPALRGIERADSVSFNPQKWLYVTKTCAMALFREFSVLDSAFRVRAPYMRETPGLVNLGEYGVQGTRHVDALKLWLSTQHIGRAAFASLIEGGYRRADFLAHHLRRRPWLRLATPPELNLVTFRAEPPGLEDAALDAWNADLQAFLLREAGIFVSLPVIRGRRWLKAVLLNPYTTESHLAYLIERMDEFARARGL